MESVDRDDYYERPSLLEMARGTAERVVFTGVSAVLGAVAGAMGFNVAWSSRLRGNDLPEEERLMGDVRFYQTLRQGVGMIVPWIQNQEYIARKKLEEMGYLPCEVCGVPHKTEERHEMPPGTYWHEEFGFVRPDDERWSAEDYDSAEDRWDMDGDKPSDDEQMH